MHHRYPPLLSDLAEPPQLVEESLVELQRLLGLLMSVVGLLSLSEWTIVSILVGPRRLCHSTHAAAATSRSSKHSPGRCF